MKYLIKIIEIQKMILSKELVLKVKINDLGKINQTRKRNYRSFR